jgi:CHAT domain-containing protein
MNEIPGLQIGAELVVLPACQTGLGKIVRGEGMVGLTRGFLQAGASRLVVSLWDVNDAATAAFMKAFYRRMKAGAGPGRALREAKVEMIRSDVPAYRHPYFWAPFVLVGNPQVRRQYPKGSTKWTGRLGKAARGGVVSPGRSRRS